MTKWKTWTSTCKTNSETKDTPKPFKWRRFYSRARKQLPSNVLLKKWITGIKMNLFFLLSLLLFLKHFHNLQNHIRNLHFLKLRLNLRYWIIKVLGQLHADKKRFEIHSRKKRNLYCLAILIYILKKQCYELYIIFLGKVLFSSFIFTKC